MVAPGVGDEEEPGLPEGSLDLIGEGSRGEAASDGRAADVPGKTEYRYQNWCFLSHILSAIRSSVIELASSVDQTAFPKSGSSFNR